MPRPVPVWSAVVTTEGGIVIDSRDLYRRFVKTLSGQPVTVTVKKLTKKRSSAQNRRYWALLTTGAISLWEDPSQAEYLHEEIAHILLPLPADPKTGLRRRMRTPDLDTADFGVYMDRVAGKLIEFGADLSEWDQWTEVAA